LDVGIRNPHEKWKWPEWVLLSKEELSVINRELRQNEDAIRLVSPACAEAFATLVHYAKDPDSAKNKTLIALLANTFFFRLYESFVQATATYSASLTEAARSVEMFLSRLSTMLVEPWTVDRMAQQCGVGLTYFSSQVIMSTGETPAKYLLRLRMKRAQELLKETKCSLREICTQTGFGGESHFVQQFSKRFGETPKAWRVKAK
jgi:AraC family L-rhamnose operon regulatory protein RhaS